METRDLPQAIYCGHITRYISIQKILLQRPHDIYQKEESYSLANDRITDQGTGEACYNACNVVSVRSRFLKFE